VTKEKQKEKRQERQTAEEVSEREGGKGRHMGQVAKGAVEAMYIGRRGRNARDTHAARIKDALVMAVSLLRSACGHATRQQ
jgi:hypothetical protein